MPIWTYERLTRDERMMIYQWAGEGYSMREICQLYNKARREGSPSMRVPGVQKLLNLPEAHKFIATFRVNFLKDIKQIPIAEKKVRLDDLEKIRQRLMYVINNIHLERSRESVTKFLSVSKRLIEVIDLARNEMEQRPGLSIGIGVGGSDLSELTDEQLQEERRNLIARAERAIKSGSSTADEVGEGDEGADQSRSATVLLAPSEELRRETLQGSDAVVSDVRQPEGGNPGVSAV